jgi:type VI secretion system protein VasD
MNYLNILKISSLYLLVALVVGCQSSKSTVGGYFDLDTDIKIDFIIDSDINPDDIGTASPLFIRLYELKSTTMMKKADFLDVYEQDEKVLGPDMVAVHRLKRFKPGQNRSEQLVLNKDTQYVALFAEFSNFSNSKFKLIVPVVSNNVFKNSATIKVSGNQLSLVK